MAIYHVEHLDEVSFNVEADTVSFDGNLMFTFWAGGEAVAFVPRINVLSIVRAPDEDD